MSFVDETSILIRDIDSRSEMSAVEKLQVDIWGVPDLDVVPLSQMAAATASGGVLIGAFDGNALVGFAYGFVGFENGKFVHHSHMLAVRSEYRSHDLGFRLKITQRDRVLQQGIEIMTWTFDPLQSRNAYFNFNKLGVTSDLYFVDFYGDNASSFLHRNGTDRLWVTWRLASERVVARLDRKQKMDPPSNIPVLVKVGEDETPIRNDLAELRSGDRVVIEVPSNINALESGNAELAAAWRQATRAAFTEALRQGYFVEDFYRTGPTDRHVGMYILTRK